MSNATSSSAEAVVGNAFLLEEILVRLPAKPLTRSKLVSKQWCSLITNPQFVQSHSSRKPNNYPTGMFFDGGGYERNKELDFVSFRGLNPFRRIPSLSFLDGIITESVPETKILQSCNGLLLCRVSTRRTKTRCYYCVCNPTSRKYRLIHEGLINRDEGERNDLFLAYDPSVSPYYKVILKQSHGYDVYSSKDQSWRKYSDSSFHPEGDAVSFNGLIYWVCFYEEQALCFDINTKKMKQVPMPPKPRLDLQFYRCLGQSGGHLYASGNSAQMDGGFCVFKMNRDFSEWVLEYDVSVCSMEEKFPSVALPRDQTLYLFSVLCVIEGLKEEDRRVALAIPGKIVSFNLKNNAAKKLCHLRGCRAEQHFEFMGVSAYPYIKTLCYV